jgi:hypothetical protein
MLFLTKAFFKTWYTSGTIWKIINGKPEISYHIKYAESIDGINWVRNNVSVYFHLMNLTNVFIKKKEFIKCGTVVKEILMVFETIK